MRKVLCFMFLVMINALVLGYSLDFNFNCVINGGDTQLLLNPSLFIYKSFFVWEDTATGVALFTPGCWLPYALLLEIFNLILNNIAFASFLFFLVLFSLPSVSMFLLSDLISRKLHNEACLKTSFFISIFYSFNLYTLITFHTPVSHTLFLYGVIPLLVFLFLKIIDTSISTSKKVGWALFYALLYFPLARMFHMFLFYSVFIPVISFGINYGLSFPIKKFVKYSILSFILICLIALPTFMMFPIVKLPPVNEAFTKSAIQVEMGNKLIDSIRFIRTFAWKCPVSETYSGILSYSFLPNYRQNPLLLFITFYPILLISSLLITLYPKLQKQEKSKILAITLVGLISLTLTVPSLTPLGKILYENKIYIFRSAWKYFTMPYILCLSIALTLLLPHIKFKLQNKTYTKLILILLLTHSLYILPALNFNSRLINRAWIIEIPQEYYELANFLNKDNENYRILTLPITKHFAGYVPYTWKYTGPDILYTLIDKPIIDKHHNVIASQVYLDLINQIEHATPTELIELCKTLNVKYIILREDVNTNHPYIKLNHPPEYYKDFLENSKEIVAKKTFGNLSLYEIKNYTPRIFLQPVPTELTSSNLQDLFKKATQKPKILQFLSFNENPIKIQTNVTNIQNFSLNITFKPFYKNKTSTDWKIINHVLIQTEQIKIAISPKGWLYIFLYLKNGTTLPAVFPFERMEKISTLEITFQNETIYIYLNKAKIYQQRISPESITDKITKIYIGSNYGDTEMLVGNIYNLTLNANNREIISDRNLFINYPEYIKQEQIYELNLNITAIEWQRISPTKYHIRINNTTISQNGFFIVFLETYDTLWKAYITKNGRTTEIPENNHIKVFNYANAWYINQTGYLEITIEYEPQRWFNLGCIISLTTLLACLTTLTITHIKQKRKHYQKRISPLNNPIQNKT